MREIKQHMHYPRQAKMRKWQGKTVVEMQLDENGSVTQMIVAKSALKMVKKSLPLPKPPRGVRTVKVPVEFRLKG